MKPTKRHSDYQGIEVPLNVRITAQTLAQLQSLARREETGISALVRKAIRQFLSRQKQLK
ncbi:MAG TPA: CopG family transcriptional regulator [Candidatus Acidoferrales bacterium]|nr:CopG family transcriptional regulator [Candidatus Acidoferrales bacterium]